MVTPLPKLDYREYVDAYLLPLEVRSNTFPHTAGNLDSLAGAWDGKPLNLHLYADGVDLQSIAPGVTWFTSGALPPPPPNAISADLQWSTTGIKIVQINVLGIQKKVYVDVPEVGTIGRAQAALLEPLKGYSALVHSFVADALVPRARAIFGSDQKANAIKHSYWASLIASDPNHYIGNPSEGEDAALFFTTAHEYSNRQENALAIDSTMDLHNNKIGAGVFHMATAIDSNGQPYYVHDYHAIKLDIATKLLNGSLRIIDHQDNNLVIKSNDKKIFPE